MIHVNKDYSVTLTTRKYLKEKYFGRKSMRAHDDFTPWNLYWKKYCTRNLLKVNESVLNLEDVQAKALKPKPRKRFYLKEAIRTRWRTFLSCNYALDAKLKKERFLRTKMLCVFNKIGTKKREKKRILKIIADFLKQPFTTLNLLSLVFSDDNFTALNRFPKWLQKGSTQR